MISTDYIDDFLIKFGSPKITTSDLLSLRLHASMVPRLSEPGPTKIHDPSYQSDRAHRITSQLHHTYLPLGLMGARHKNNVEMLTCSLCINNQRR